MVLTMAPTVAFAADTTSDPAAQSNPVAQIKGAQKSSVYFGNYKQSSDGNGDYLTEPIKWRVLQSADGKLFLLADKILDVYYYHHNGSTSTAASKGWRIPQGSPSSLWEGVSKFHYPPRCHRARFAESGLRLRRSLGWLFRNRLLEAIVVAAHLMPLSRGFCACIMVYSVFNVQRKASWRMSLHLSPILGHFCKVFLKNLRNIF